MGVCLPNIVCSSVKRLIHKRVCNQVVSILTVLDNRDIGLINNPLFQSNNENFVIKLTPNYERRNGSLCKENKAYS